MENDLTKDQFTARFVAEMMAVRPPTDDEREDAERYANQAAVAAWEDLDQRSEGPEECARTDISYWGEDGE